LGASHAAVTTVDLQLGLGNTSTSGCETADWAGFPTGNIALLQRGTCTFELKAENAAAAGAVGIVIFNQGNTTATDRNNIPAVTLTANNTSGIPVLGTTYALGETLAGLVPAGLRMRVFANTLRQILPTANVLAEKRGTTTNNNNNNNNNNNVVMAGAHLDSVLAGPGINHNGSGSASILEVAEQLAHVKLQNTVRFAWWGAEESGLVGSTNYVNGLSQAQKDRIALYLNFDMVGSPNYIFMTQDADQSSFTPPAGVNVPDGSIEIEDLFESFYTLRGQPYDDAAFDGRSDYQAFINKRHPGRRPLHRRGGSEDRRAAVDLGRHRGCAVRPVLPRGLRHLRQQQRPCACHQRRSDRVRDADVRVLDPVGQRRAGQDGPGRLPDSGSGRLAAHVRPETNPQPQNERGGRSGRPLLVLVLRLHRTLGRDASTPTT
jgi:Peptidase family M28/PA domain